MLNFLIIENNKKWSGYEFFSFMKSEVVKIVSVDHVYILTSSKHKKCTAKMLKRAEVKDQISLRYVLNIRS